MKDLNIVFAGFGGQGILFAGKVVAYAGSSRAGSSLGCRPTARRCAAAPRIAAFVSPMNPSARRL